MEEECGDPSVHDIVTDPPSSYAGAAGGGTHKITFTLDADKKNDFHVTGKDVGRLVYSRLDAPPHSLLAYDDVMYRKLTVILKGSVDLGSLNLTQALEIRDGLRTKPIFPPTKEKDVHIYWAPLTLDNTKIETVLLQFGQMVGTLGNIGVKNKVYHAKEDDDEVTKMMDGVTLTDRICKMVITHSIPSHILVEGIKIKIVYDGQSRTCGRCYKFWSLCPGNGKVEVCRAKAEAENKEKEKKGGKATKAPSMKSNWNKLQKKLEEKMKKGVNTELLNGEFCPGAAPKPTCLRLSSLPVDVTLPELYNVLRSNHCGDIEGLEDKISIDGVPGTADIRELDNIDYELITENIDGVFIRGGKRIKVTPVQECTPEKPKENSEKEKTPAENGASATPPSPTQSKEPSKPVIPPPAAQASSKSTKSKDKVSPSVNSKDDGHILRTPKTTVQQIASWSTNKTAASSKVYERVSESGRKFDSRKKLRLSSDEETSPGTNRVQTRRSKRSKDSNSSFKHSSK